MAVATAQDDIRVACKALTAAKFLPMPHLPASRFESSHEFRSTLESLVHAGATQVLVLGGNDLQERLKSDSCAYATGACGLLEAEIALLQTSGIKTVALVGHPDGHPELGWNEARTTAVLIQKARKLLEGGFDVVVVAQFCFDSEKLVRWLNSSREALLLLRAELIARAKPCGTVVFRIGVPGPTPLKRLERIAHICKVPLPATLSLSTLSGTEGEWSYRCACASDPSVEAADSLSTYWPEDTILSIVAYCEHSGVQSDEVMLHIFPFGGLSRTCDLIAQLQGGTWPKFAQKMMAIWQRLPSR